MTIIGAWADAHDGPGWSNQVVWVVLYDPGTNKHTVRGLQPDEQPAEVRAMFPVFAAASRELVGAVKGKVTT